MVRLNDLTSKPRSLDFFHLTIVAGILVITTSLTAVVVPDHLIFVFGMNFLNHAASLLVGVMAAPGFIRIYNWMIGGFK